MATKSTIVKMKKIEELIKKYAEQRKQLKEKKDYFALARLPRNSSPTRLRRICKLTGRTRAVYRKFGISRIVLRDLYHRGLIPGMRKASW
jgi:small subunit ribosomal protein S14